MKKPVHAVVAELQLRDAAALAFALFRARAGTRRCSWRCAAAGRARRRSRSAITSPSRSIAEGSSAMACSQQRVLRPVFADARSAARAAAANRMPASSPRNAGQGGQRRAQLHQVARARRAQRHARQDALHVADGRQRSRQRFGSAVLAQRCRWPHSAAQQRRDRAAAGSASAAARASPSPWRSGSSSANSVASSLPVRLRSSSRLRRVVASSVQPFVATLHGERADVRQRGLLRVLHVLQQRARGAQAGSQVCRRRSRRGRACRTARQQSRRGLAARSARAGAAACGMAKLARAGPPAAAVPPAAAAPVPRPVRRSPCSSLTQKRPLARSSQARPCRSPSACQRPRAGSRACAPAARPRPACRA